MNYQEVLAKAKEVMAPKCRVCPECNGLACKGEQPGVGASGSGMGFTECRTYFKNVKVHMDAVHDEYEVDSSIELFGKTFDYPFFPAPIGGMVLNYTGYLSEAEYCDAVVNGALDAGIFAFTGDGPVNDYFKASLPIIEKAEGKAVSTIKPWTKEKIMDRISDIKAVGGMALAMDIDSASLVNLKLKGTPAFTKSEEELREIVQTAGVPFIVKGIMTPASAMRCVNAGAYAIVVSNHGGRIMEDFPAPISVLQEIREVVGDRAKIFVDGGVRSGSDVFKCLALGADAVLIGRPYAIAAHGGRAEGVKIYTEKIGTELRELMRMTDCRTLKDITADKIINRNN